MTNKVNHVTQTKKSGLKHLCFQKICLIIGDDNVVADNVMTDKSTPIIEN